jgi:hypothetical protein
MLPLKRSFTSPQTSSVYKIVVKWGDFTLCYRKDGNIYRVRVQCEDENKLNYLLANMQMGYNWGFIKNDDHISMDVNRIDLKNILADAMRAIIKYFEESTTD